MRGGRLDPHPGRLQAAGPQRAEHGVGFRRRVLDHEEVERAFHAGRGAGVRGRESGGLWDRHRGRGGPGVVGVSPRVAGAEWLAWAPLAVLTLAVGLVPALVLAATSAPVRALTGVLP